MSKKQKKRIKISKNQQHLLDVIKHCERKPPMPKSQIMQPKNRNTRQQIRLEAHRATVNAKNGYYE